MGVAFFSVSPCPILTSLKAGIFLTVQTKLFQKILFYQHTGNCGLALVIIAHQVRFLSVGFRLKWRLLVLHFFPQEQFATLRSICRGLVNHSWFHPKITFSLGPVCVRSDTLGLVHIPAGGVLDTVLFSSNCSNSVEQRLWVFGELDIFKILDKFKKIEQNWFWDFLWYSVIMFFWEESVGLCIIHCLVWQVPCDGFSDIETLGCPSHFFEDELMCILNMEGR